MTVVRLLDELSNELADFLVPGDRGKFVRCRIGQNRSAQDQRADQSECNDIPRVVASLVLSQCSLRYRIHFSGDGCAFDRSQAARLSRLSPSIKGKFGKIRVSGFRIAAADVECAHATPDRNYRHLARILPFHCIQPCRGAIRLPRHWRRISTSRA